MDKRQQSDFQAQYADTSSAIWDACPYAKVVKSYRDTCYDYVNPVLCNEDNVRPPPPAWDGCRRWLLLRAAAA